MQKYCFYSRSLKVYYYRNFEHYRQYLQYQCNLLRCVTLQYSRRGPSFFSSLPPPPPAISEATTHRVDRVLGFFSSRPNGDPPTPSTAGECVPLPLIPGGNTIPRERGGGVPIRTRGQTLWYSRYLCTFLPLPILCISLSSLCAAGKTLPIPVDGRGEWGSSKEGE
jgi:hypothetical protein